MAITTDASTPAAVSGSGTYSAAKTTAAFSPPANAVLLARVVLNGASSGAVTAAITDSLSGTWTLRKRENDNSTTTPGIGGTVEVWWKFQSAAQTNMTVSMTGSGAGAASGYLLKVTVLNGASSTQAGTVAGTFRNNSTGAALQAAITPGAAGNIVVGAAMDYVNSTAPTLLGNTVNDASLADAVNGDWYGIIAGSAATVASSTTYGYSTSLAQWLIALVEIQAAAGGGTAWTDTATPTFTFGVTADGTVARVASASPAFTFGVTADGTVARVASASPSFVWAVTADGVVARVAQASPTFTFAVSANGVVARVAQASPTFTFGVAADGVVARFAQATVPFTFNVLADATVTHSGKTIDASPAFTFAVSADGVVARVAAASAGFVWAVTADGVVSRFAAVTAPFSFGVTAAASRGQTPQATVPFVFAVLADTTLTRAGTIRDITLHSKPQPVRFAVTPQPVRFVPTSEVS